MDIYIRMDSNKELHMDINMDSNKAMCMVDIHMDTDKECYINYTGMDEEHHRNHIVFDNYPQHYLHRCNCFCLLRHSIRRIRSVFRIDGYQVADSFGKILDNSFYTLHLYKKVS